MEEIIIPTVWASFELNTLYAYLPKYGIHPRDLNHADSVYMPSDWIPEILFVRTSSSSKRLDKGIDVVAVESPSPKSVSVVDILCSGSKIGMAVLPKEGVYTQAHFTPDGCLLLTGASHEDTIVKEGTSFKTMKSFMIGPKGDNPKRVVHDCLVTAKKRWFRSRNDPKFLGFSKDK